MQMKRILCMVLSGVLLVSVISLSANAAETQATSLEILCDEHVSPLATGYFNLIIPEKTNAKGDIVFPLAAGETVTNKASHFPFSASLDFGITATDGNYYGFSITSGSIDKTIRISERGDYIFQIRNNSSTEIEVSGFVNY